MIKNRKNESLCRWGSVLSFTILLVLGLSVAFDIYYDLNDDTVIKDIISGTYTGNPSGYSIQMLYPLSWLLAVFYTAIPGVAWYGLFLCLCQFGALAVIGWRLTGIVQSRKLQLVLLAVEAVVAAGLLLRNFVYVQYSVTSGICMAAAIFWYITGEKGNDWLSYLKQNIVAIVFVWLAFCIRTELCVMLLPFLLLAGFVNWLAEERFWVLENVKKYMSLILAALAGMLLLYAVDACAYASSEWKDFRKLFQARTDLYDFYGIPDYDVNQEFYQGLGLTRQSYALLQNYNFSLDEEIDAELMQAIVEYQEQQAVQGQNLYSIGGLVYKNSPKKALWSYKNHLLNDTSYLVLAGYVLYFLLAFSRKRSGCYWKLFMLFGARSVVWFYLFMVDRLPERITTPLVLAEVIVLTGWIVQEFRVQYTVNKAMVVEGDVRGEGQLKLMHLKLGGSLLILGLCGVVTLMINVEQTRQEYKNRTVANERWEALIAYCEEHPEYYYSVDVYSSTSYQGAIYSEKIFKDVDSSYRNFDICGGWAAKSPLMYDKLMQKGITELEAALIAEDGNAFFVAACDKDISWLADYYLSQGYQTRSEIKDTISTGKEAVFYVYQIMIAD